MEESEIQLKVCCMKSLDEVLLAHQYGAHAVGLVGEMPSGPGMISDDQAKALAAAAPPDLETFLLSSRTTAESISAHVDYCKPSTVQIVWHVDTAVHEELARTHLVRRVQVIHVEDESAIELAQTYAPVVDALLLDSGKPSAQTIELGGTGRTHDWSLSREIVNSVSVPVYLAGGLNPDNIRAAVDAVDPYGVDLCTGVRTNGVLDQEKLAAFTKGLFDF